MFNQKNKQKQTAELKNPFKSAHATHSLMHACQLKHLKYINTFNRKMHIFAASRKGNKKSSSHLPAPVLPHTFKAI